MKDTISLWESITENKPNYPNLNKDIEVDVAIIGGGITGVTTALRLIEAGKDVAVLEADKVGSGTTGFSTGNLYVAVQPYYQHIITKFNIEIAKKIAHSRQFAIDYIASIVEEKNITCQFARRPWFLFTSDESKLAFLKKEIETLKKLDISINDTKTLPIPLKFKKAAVMENQARFNPLQYVIGIAENLHKKGCQIFENTRVMEVEENDDHCVLTTKNGKVTAKQVVIATHTPIGINLSQMFTAPYRSYVVAVELRDKTYPEGHFWDLDSPHHAVCTHALKSEKPELLLVAGSHHKTGQGQDLNSHYQELESFLEDHFDVSHVAYRWSAQHYQSADDVPYIGLASRFARRTYIATGFSADGLIYGTLSGIIIADEILKKENELSPVYDSNRFKPIASSSFVIKENANVFMQYLKDYPILTPAHFDAIKKGEGKIVESNMQKLAVSRDKNNKVHVVSAVCTHMKCIVDWNDAEQTWDCPCHGSRFTCEGKVIEGPAKIDLEKINKE